MLMVGSTCGFITQYPIDDNIVTYQHITFKMNKIGIQQNISSRYLQWKRSKESTCSTSVQSIKWAVKHPVLHLSHIYVMTCPSMTSIERCECQNWISSGYHGEQTNREHKGLCD